MDKKLSYDSLSSLYANFGELYKLYGTVYDSIQDVGSDRITGNDERTERINASNQAEIVKFSNEVKEYQVHVDHARRRLSKMKAEYEYYKNERDRALREAREAGTSLKDLFKNAFGTAEINRFKRMDAEINFLESFLSDYDKLTDMVNSPNAVDLAANMYKLMDKMNGEVVEVVSNTVVSRVKVEDLGDKKRVVISYDGFEFKPIEIPNDEFTMEKVEQIRNAVICKATLDKEKEMKVVLDVNGKEIETTLSQMGANLVEELAHKVTQEEVKDVEVAQEVEMETPVVEIETPEVETPEVEAEELTAEQKYENDGYGKNAFGEYFNPNIDEYDPEYNPELDPLYATPVQEEVEAEELTAEQKYENDGYGKNAFGEYFNPNIDEYDPEYNPELDPLYATPVQEEVVPEEVTPESPEVSPEQNEGNQGTGDNNDTPEETEEQDLDNGTQGTGQAAEEPAEERTEKKSNNQRLYSDKTYQVMEARECFKKVLNKGTMLNSIAAAGLFGLAVTTGIGTMPLAAGATAIAVGSQVIQALDELIYKARRASVKYTLRKLAKKVNCTFRCEDGKAYFYSDVLERSVTKDDLEELQASNENNINIQEKLDTIFDNDLRGVTWPYKGFQRVEVDNLEAAFEEFGGVKKEDEIGLWTKIKYGVKKSVSDAEVPQEEEKMAEATSVSAEEVAAELEGTPVQETAQEATQEEVEETQKVVQEQTQEQTEEVAQVQEGAEAASQEEVEEAQEMTQEGATLDDEAVQYMVENSSVAEQIGNEASVLEAESVSQEEIQEMLDAEPSRGIG